tara:strand:+ start:161 stop:487 length:327 start_codon:yes stop_codon:yes gene_type:complete
MNILEILETFYADQEWTLVNNDYESLHWGENNPTSKPTLEELEDKWNNNKTPIDDKAAQKSRQVEILAKWPIEKQFEAITEFHMERPEKMNELMDDILTIKEKYPKTS